MKAFLFPVAAMCCLGCGSSKNECSCDDPAIHVRIPPDRAPAFADIVLSGAACAGVQPTCVMTAGSTCSVFAFSASAAGKCHVDVDFSSGPPRFSADLQTVDDTCCRAFYASPRSAGEIEVPGSADAGGAG